MFAIPAGMLLGARPGGAKPAFSICTLNAVGHNRSTPA